MEHAAVSKADAVVHADGVLPEHIPSDRSRPFRTVRPEPGLKPWVSLADELFHAPGVGLQFGSVNLS